MNGHYEIGDYVLTNWKLVKLLGTGAYGKVYEAEREEFGETYKAAIKIMTIPQAESEIWSARSEGMTETEVTEYFQNMVKQIVNECIFMNKVKGAANIVGYEDHVVLPHQGQVGWDVIIRMELLTPLLKYVVTNPLKTEDVVKLGIDVCRALEVCQKMNIIHRDVKPENVMVSALGDYKLGDFGISRTMEKTQSGLSQKGTASYMAPEVSKGEAYGHTVDVYSLGLMLYRFLNENRAPFLPAPPAPISFNDRESAQERRINGEPLPMPSQANPELARIVLKACAYRPSDRYDSATQMREELEAWLRARKKGEVGSFAASEPAAAEAPVREVQLPAREVQQPVREAQPPLREVQPPRDAAPREEISAPEPTMIPIAGMPSFQTPARTPQPSRQVTPEMNAEVAREAFPKREDSRKNDDKAPKMLWHLGVKILIVMATVYHVILLLYLKAGISEWGGREIFIWLMFLALGTYGIFTFLQLSKLKKRAPRHVVIYGAVLCAFDVYLAGLMLSWLYVSSSLILALKCVVELVILLINRKYYKKRKHMFEN